jgi:hypothetical protein
VTTKSYPPAGGVVPSPRTVLPYSLQSGSIFFSLGSGSRHLPSTPSACLADGRIVNGRVDGVVNGQHTSRQQPRHIPRPQAFFASPAALQSTSSHHAVVILDP